jgi:hypothetical protein
MRRAPEPLSLAMILKEVEELLFLIQRLDRAVVGDEEGTRLELEARITLARQRLAEIIIQRSV